MKIKYAGLYDGDGEVANEAIHELNDYNVYENIQVDRETQASDNNISIDEIDEDGYYVYVEIEMTPDEYNEFLKNRA